MAYNTIGGLPPQQLSFSRKNKKWRRACVDCGDGYSLMNYDLTLRSVEAMNINYDLMQGKLHMGDLKQLVNPFGIEASFIPDSIQHYPIINSKTEVLKGEESKRLFDFRVIVTNPNAISEIEEEKNKLINQRLQQWVMDSYQDEQEAQQELQKISDYFTYEYQDKREVRGNLVLNHYIKELEMPLMFNKGFGDKINVDEELYQCDIVGGEPYIERLDPRDVRIITSGNSNRVEDADMIVIDQYWNKGRIYDTYWDQLTQKDREELEKMSFTGKTYADSMDNINSPWTVVPQLGDWTAGDAVIDPNELFSDGVDRTRGPWDSNGNIRVLRVYWKSRRKIKKVKSYDPETGEEQFNFYPETYIPKTEEGEEEQIFWINEAWEGTKIGDSIYVNMRPRPVQYNRLSNPSKCHFGIIGSIGSTKNDTPYSLVDIMKPYAYLYDVMHDRLNKTLARNHGKLVKMDFAKTPDWPVDKWLYYITTHGILVEDSFKEGDKGRSTGVLGGQMNNASTGVVDASLGTEIQSYITILEWCSNKAGEMAGISKQREGQVSNRETVGGVERATLQSAHSTEWLFVDHESVKKRCLECFLETAKIAFKGRKIKFKYILDDGSEQLVELDGDEFAECDYGLAVDNSSSSQELNQNLQMYVQAGIQNGMSMSTAIKTHQTRSLAEKAKLIEADERRRQEMAQQQQQQEMQLEQQKLQQQAQIEQMKQEMEYRMHQEDNQVKILVAEINSQAEANRLSLMNEENGITREQENEYKRRQLELDAQQFKEKLSLDKQKHQDDVRLKEKQINKTASKKS